jgi:hypothetical protein
MGRDLYSCDLKTMTFDDVEAFVALDLPEGNRVDYKGAIPQEIGDIVAAFSNTYGGIVLLGVGKSGSPRPIPGIPRGRTDLQTTIVNRVVSTVQPRPMFEVGVVAHREVSENDVAVLRVEPGNYPPYASLTYRNIPIRIGDKNERALVPDLERLFALRGQEPGAHALRDLPLLQVTVTTPQGAKPSPTYMRIWAIPSRPASVLLHRATEQRFLELIQNAFGHYGDIAISGRRQDAVEFIYRAPKAMEVRDFSARWHITGDGSVGFVVQAARVETDSSSFRGSIFLYDLVWDSLTFLRCAADIMKEVRWPGRMVLAGDLGLDQSEISPSGSNGELGLGGFGAWDRSRMETPPTRLKAVLERPSEEEAACQFVADLLLKNLREQRGMDVDYDKLLSSVVGLRVALGPNAS